jgi:hypothetical protein
MIAVRSLGMARQFKPGIMVLASVALGCASACLGQAPLQIPLSNSAQKMDAAGGQTPDQQLPGSISGTVVDQSGAVVVGAKVRLITDQQSPNQSSRQEILSGDDGQFSFPRVAPGAFHLTITSQGFGAQTSSGILHPGETQIFPEIALNVANTNTDVEVGLTRTEVAEEEIKVQEKQRVFGVLPNFYVSYVADPVSLTPKQKFEIAWKTLIDPATFIFVGGAAGIEQAQNHFKEYGQGSQGYGQRFGAGYADTITSTLIGSALLPTLLKQDPRYFYKGTGSTRSRALYAVANSIICKGDNGHWQVSYSNIMGSLAAGGISNLYYPSQDRNGAGLTFENGAIGIGATAAANLFQEFLVRKLTPNAHHKNPGQP